MIGPFDIVGHVCCAAITQFYCVGVEYFIKFVMLRKMLLTRLRKILPILLLTLLLNGGLNKIIFRFLCHFSVSLWFPSYDNTWFYPLSTSAELFLFLFICLLLSNHNIHSVKIQKILIYISSITLTNQ